MVENYTVPMPDLEPVIPIITSLLPLAGACKFDGIEL